MSAGRSTSPKLEKHAPQKGYPVAAAIRTPRFIAPHRRAAHAGRAGQAQSSQRVRHLSATPWTPVIRIRSREGATPFSHRPDRGEPRLHPAEGMPRRRRFDVGGSGLSGRWSLRVPSPAPFSSADEARGDPCRLQHHERPHAPMAPDRHHGGWSGSRWFCRSTVSLSSRISRETRTDRIVPALPADEQRLDLSWSRCGQRWASYNCITNCRL